MDHEKAYKNLVAKVKNAYLFAQTDSTKKVLEDILPQLRESEDERIKNCIRCLTSLDQAQDVIEDMGFTRQDLLVWLKKQKERKNPLEDYSRGYNDGYYHGATDNAKKEQKPEEKQDYSGLTDFERAIHRGFLCAGVENVPVTIIKETAQDCLAQMPVEWSEEDEEMAMKIDCYLSSAIGVSEDERQSIDNWLKSLRPSWKPSEEQMYVLERLISRYRYCWDEDTRKTMELLDEDLKRL